MKHRTKTEDRNSSTSIFTMDQINPTGFIDRLLSIASRFGYTRTITNRIHLIYWFLGEFYHSKIFSWKYTLLWKIMNVIDIILLFSHLTSYVFFSPTLELSHMLLVSDMTISGLYFMILIPLASNLYHKRTSEAFKILDENINLVLKRYIRTEYHSSTIHLAHQKRNVYSLNTAFGILAAQFSCMACYIICTNLDLFIGYTKAKLSDPNYYLYPVYCKGINSGYVFSVLLFSQIMAATPIIITYLIIPFFSIVTVREFHRKFQTLSDSLAYQSKLFAYHYERLPNNSSNDPHLDSNQMEKSTLQNYFVQDIHSYAQFHQNLIRGISHLKPYLEFNMSISIIMFLFFEILLLYTFILPQNQDSIMIRIKSLNYAVIICAIFFVNCLAGKLFTDMEDMFREAVYNIPWYHLPPSNRHLIYMLLYSAQTKIEFKALKVYSMNMELFLKFWQHVYSIVNVLRRVTM